jgi:hypothetical protein
LGFIPTDRTTADEGQAVSEGLPILLKKVAFEERDYENDTKRQCCEKSHGPMSETTKASSGY